MVDIASRNDAFYIYGFSHLPHEFSNGFLFVVAVSSQIIGKEEVQWLF
ncbi:hypothetical protein EVA_11380 [gut metagenome]|uniref:Uncharacterized protein n=1 Tax=gut metagenome TaxID=749906 RepID=J9G105_9ZZZZ